MTLLKSYAKMTSNMADNELQMRRNALMRIVYEMDEQSMYQISNHYHIINGTHTYRSMIDTLILDIHSDSELKGVGEEMIVQSKIELMDDGELQSSTPEWYICALYELIREDEDEIEIPGMIMN